MMEESFFLLDRDESPDGAAEPDASFVPKPAPPPFGDGAHAERILLGMPQLCLNGLSENWLLKELGHRHWLMLARLAGQTAPHFVDERGEPVYAAFCALSIKDADFAAARENDILTIHSRVERISRTQVLTRHRLVIGGKALGEVELLSTFVRRLARGENHGVARYEPPGWPPAPARAAKNDLAARAAAFRAGRIREHLGFNLSERAPLREATFLPCPSQDFNGAGLLYFAQFIAFVDRAEWLFAPDLARRATTRRRDVFFFGNLDPGEALSVRLMEQRSDEHGMAHRCLMIREQDQAPLAQIFSVRRCGQVG
ncbi:Pnap_2097 family protein [Rhodoblastus sp.]|uniref:Pnap_2097 family protein n=1 Tax=Rhodoblastus sp. TaxID=1962975 RepID=UPI0035B0A161